MESLQDKLQQWADKTAQLYHTLALNRPGCDLAFYTQSDLTKAVERPELMILAINPGSGGTYQDLIDNESWQEWGVHGYMDGGTLLKGNPSFHKRETEWHLWKRLRNILSRGGIGCMLDDEYKFLFTNIILFSTRKTHQLPQIVFEECPRQTIELIQLLQPKRILCLGKQDCFDQLKSYMDFVPQELIPGEISFGRLRHTPIYGIPHTSKRYSKEEMEMVGKCLGYLFAHTDESVSPEDIQTRFETEIRQWKKRRPKSKCWDWDYQTLIDLLGKEKAYEVKPTAHRFDLPGYLALTVTSQGYVAIRAKIQGNKDDWNSNLANKQQYIDLLRRWDWQPDGTWLGRKAFSDFKSSEELLNEIKTIRAELVRMY